MADDDIQAPKLDTENNVIHEEIKFQYFWYLFVFFTIYLTSYIVPAFLFMGYIFLFFLPNFLEVSNFIAFFTEIKPILALISMPLVIIGCYLIRLFLLG